MDRAIVEYREAVRLFPDDYASQFNLAMTLQAKGDSPAAIPEFQRAITLAPGEPSFHVSLGLSLEKVGRTADAVREYRQFLAMQPTSPDAAKLKAHIEVLSAAPPINPSASHP
jgi:Flp pilus assembly protein TadD